MGARRVWVLGGSTRAPRLGISKQPLKGQDTCPATEPAKSLCRSHHCRGWGQGQPLPGWLGSHGGDTPGSTVLWGNTQHRALEGQTLAPQWQQSQFPTQKLSCPREITRKQRSGISKTSRPARTGSVCFENNCKTSTQNLRTPGPACQLRAAEEPLNRKADYLLTALWLRCFSWHLRRPSYFEGLFAARRAEKTAIPFPF